MSLDEFSNICAALDLSADEIFSQAFLVTNDQRPDRNQGQPQRMMGEGS